MKVAIADPKKEKPLKDIFMMLENLRNKPSLQRNFALIANDLLLALPKMDYYASVTTLEKAHLLETYLDFKLKTNLLNVDAQV